jgi:predicted unusual protein kinase regulating ubiquinone biosynthesis (AarF/ABC1/UbiB family)
MRSEGDGIDQGRLRRSAPLAGLAARTTGEAVVAALRSRATGGDSAQFHARTADRYAELLGRSKGALMKVGQMLSYVTLLPAIPAEYRGIYQTALGRLLAEVPPMAPELARATLESALGHPVEEAFADFEAQPLAAASIGQVHAGRLHDGRRVAVKVQYPGVARAIRADLRNAELLAAVFQFIRSIAPGLMRLDMRAVADEVGERITEELDYSLEATNQMAFADSYRGHPGIHVPDVVEELSTSRVLTQDLVDGLWWTEALGADPSLKDRWGETIYRFHTGSLRRLGLFNADPNPGNYLFHPDGTVSFVDFGCVKRFGAERVAWIADMVRAVIDGDAAGLQQGFVDAGIFDTDHAPAAQDVLAWYGQPFELVRGPQPFTVKPDYVAHCVERNWSPMGPSGRAVRLMDADAPADLYFLSRMQLGLLSVLGELGATGYWGSIEAEYDGDPPLTAMGKADADFWTSRRTGPGRAS